jgi:hypothetical protein
MQRKEKGVIGGRLRSKIWYPNSHPNPLDFFMNNWYDFPKHKTKRGNKSIYIMLMFIRGYNRK